jgi:hypothetical protein
LDPAHLLDLPPNLCIERLRALLPDAVGEHSAGHLQFRTGSSSDKSVLVLVDPNLPAFVSCKKGGFRSGPGLGD